MCEGTRLEEDAVVQLALDGLAEWLTREKRDLARAVALGHARTVGCLLRARVEPYGDNSLDAVDVDLLAMACAHGHANVASLRAGWPGLLLACGKRLHRCCTSADSPLLGHEGQKPGGF